MRKIYRLFFGLSIIAALASCQMEPAIDTPTEGEGILLKLEAGDMELRTKADSTRPGNDDGTTFNENTLGSSVDIFFFPEGSTDESTSTKSLRATVRAGGYVQLPVSMGDIYTIFGGTVAGSKADVYVVANYNGTTAINHSTHYTLAQLKALQLAKADWTPLPQEKCVMTGKATITLANAASNTPASGTVQMRRIAAKVTFRLTVADEIVVQNVTRNGEGVIVDKKLDTWHPIKEAMTVYLQYGMNYARLSGEPQRVPANAKGAGAADSLFTYKEYKLVETTEKKARMRTIIDSEPYKVDGEWVIDTHEENVQVPVYVTKHMTHHTEGGADIGDLSGLNGPFYTYPVTWDPGVATEPFLKLIIPWNNGSSTKYYYYKVPFAGTALEANNWYEVTLDVQILGGEDELPVPLEATYKVVDWVVGEETEAATVAARYLSVPVREFTLYNMEELEIPMLSSHPCEITNVTITKPHYGKGTAPSYDITDIDELSVLSQEAIYLKHSIINTMGNSLDVTPYTITFRVRQIDEPDDYYADITVTQYPAIYMLEPVPGGRSFVDGYYSNVNGQHHQYSGNYSTQFNTYTMPYGVLRDRVGTNDQTDMTVITVTSFNESSSSFSYTVNGEVETYDYIIAAPRTNEKNWNSLTAYWGGSRAVAWSADDISAIKVATPEYNYIAPQFMITSMWGRNYGSSDINSIERAQQRCATYQEAGYPAGRWRLPTDAEVMFIINLQRYGFIEDLFVGYYWTSSGSRLNGTDMNNVSVTRNSTQSNSLRCVYDTWYWGLEPVADPSTYTIWPEPTDTPAATAAQVN